MSFFVKVVFALLVLFDGASSRAFCMKSFAEKVQIAVAISSFIDKFHHEISMKKVERLNVANIISCMQSYMDSSEQQEVYSSKIDAAVVRVFVTLVKYASDRRGLRLEEKTMIYKAAIRAAQWVGFPQDALSLWQVLFNAGHGFDEAIEIASLNMQQFAAPLLRELLSWDVVMCLTEEPIGGPEFK